MLPVISVPSTGNSFSLPASGAAAMAATSDVAVGRLPVATVAPSVTLPELKNNTRGNSGARPPMAMPTPTAAQPLFTPGLASRISEPTLNMGTSTLFLAQLFGQSSTPVSITGSTSQFVDYSTFVQYGLVKYKPSNAAMVQFSKPDAPTAEPSRGEQIRMAARQAAQQLDNLLAARQAARAAAATPAPAAQAASPAQSTATTQVERPEVREARTQAAQRAISRGGAATSLIRQRGVEAYMATFARNYANLNKPAAVTAEIPEAKAL